MKLSKNEVIVWLQNPDVVSGMELLHRIKPMHKSINLAAIKAKLCYATGLPTNYQPETKTQHTKQTTKPQPKNPKQTKKILNQQSEISNQQPGIKTPAFIEKIIKEHAHLVQLRSQLSEERLALGHDNKPAIVKKRKILTQSIHQHSDRIETLFNAKENYFTKNIMPDMNTLFPSSPQTSKTKTKSKTKPKPKPKS